MLGKPQSGFYSTTTLSPSIAPLMDPIPAAQQGCECMQAIRVDTSIFTIAFISAMAHKRTHSG
jgi:hypothetical protein